MDFNMAKKISVGIVNPVAKAMLQERKSPQVVLPKKGSKAKRNRKQEKHNAIRDAKLYQDD
jgi:hypothetical protein